MQFSRNMLPILGVTFHSFATQEEATAFAEWAERETKGSERPCDALVIHDPDRPEGDQYEVKVSNW